MDIEQARFNMVEQQIRTWEVLDQDVLDLLFAVRREEFVPAALSRCSRSPTSRFRCGRRRAMWSPKMEARVLQELELQPGESVLEIGTGSGYFTALLAGMGARVTSVEIDPALAAEARRKLARAGLRRRRAARSATARAAGAARPTTRSCSPARRRCCPTRSCEQLNPGGRVFAVVGEAPAMTARLVRWVAPGALRRAHPVRDRDRAADATPQSPARFEF